MLAGRRFEDSDGDSINISKVMASVRLGAVKADESMWVTLYLSKGQAVEMGESLLAIAEGME